MMRPVPGTATEQDVLDLDAHSNRLCELVDGVLVEKTMGIKESILALALAFRIQQFVQARQLGVVSGEAGTIRLFPGQVRMPDIAYFSWDRLPDRRMPDAPIPAIAPDLAVEILSKGNTKREMTRKLQEYFEAGTHLVWYVDPTARTIAVYTKIGDPTLLNVGDTLDGGKVLPGFSLPARELFAVLDQKGS